MPDYDGSHFDPPAAVARVMVRTLDHARRADNVAMLIDTGADVTLLPRSCVDQLQLPVETRTDVILLDWHGGDSSTMEVKAELVFLGCNFRGQFLIVDQDYGILGRNVLNNVSLLLDGPKLNWREA
jgi:predicted aspartyl protease